MLEVAVCSVCGSGMLEVAVCSVWFSNARGCCMHCVVQ